MICKIVKSKMCKHFTNFVILCVVFLCAQVKAKLPLIFPPTSPTRVQWISGIGIPLEDLRFEAMTSGWVLKAEYFLPDNITQLKHRSETPLSPRKFEQFLVSDEEISDNARSQKLKEDKPVLTSYRWSVYKALEGLANRMGMAGRDCVLKSICEHAENPFYYYNGLIGELLHILLTPSSSTDSISTHSDNEYFHAEHVGRSGADCEGVYRHCPRSLLDRFSDFHHLSNDIMSIIG